MVGSDGLGLGGLKSSGSLVVALIPSNMEVSIFVEKLLNSSAMVCASVMCWLLIFSGSILLLLVGLF